MNFLIFSGRRRRSTDRETMSIEQAKKVLRIEADAIARLIDRLDENFDRAVDLIMNCRGRVVVTGMGKSGHIANKIAATLASTGTPALFLHPAEGIHGDSAWSRRGTSSSPFRTSGETEELSRMLPSLKRIGIKIIALTGNLESTLARTATWSSMWA